MQKLFVAVLVVLATAASSLAQSNGTALNPFYVREWQSLYRLFNRVDCTAVNTALITAEDAQCARSFLLINEDAADGDTVRICPRLAGPGQCDGDEDGFPLWGKSSVAVNVSTRDAPWSCFGAATISVLGEKACLPSPTPTAIPAPTQTPVPTPTPAPT